MKYILRDYQKECSDAAVNAFQNKQNGVLICPTGGGKSLIIADIASRLNSPLLIFNPSKEILEQNFEKLQSYGIIDCGIYSASFNSKDINRITLATIGSVIRHMDDFKSFRYVLIDEAHLVNSKGGMYKEFLESCQRTVIGLTATPYRLYSSLNGSILKFITRTRPRIFNKVIYYCQIDNLLKKGFLADLKYYDVTNIDMRNVKSNSTGADYDEKSLVLEYERCDFYSQLQGWVERLLHPKNGIPRKGILVFTRFIKEAQRLTSYIPNSSIVTGETPKKERKRILKEFKEGKIKVVANVGTLTTGFDYPELDTVVIARPTKSLALYYQIVGRAIRPYKGKEGWIVDLCGNYQRFGRVSDLWIGVEKPRTERWCVYSGSKQLTGVTF